ncbi:uncharacterized protein V1518DRAFT_404640 [Limtongia smithiae]|uniref:uncharacterized protein n=1 Tax=Limtongia smithiae TaxID=1125753 RepID=UPI0034CEDEB6
MLTVLLFSSGVEHGETEDNEDKVGAGDKSLEYSCDIKTDAICYGVSVPKENAAAVESEKEGSKSLWNSTFLDFLCDLETVVILYDVRRPSDVDTDLFLHGIDAPESLAITVEPKRDGELTLTGDSFPDFLWSIEADISLHQMMEIYREGQTPERIGFVDGITPHVQNVIGRGMLLGRAVVRTVDDGVQRAITATYLKHAKKFSNTYRPGNNLDSVISLSDYRVKTNTAKSRS